MAPGWYNGIALNDYKNAGLDAKAANAQAWTNIKSRMNYFGKNTNYMIDFFSKKIISQWNEPTYESIWVSKVKSHANELNWIGNGCMTAVSDSSLNCTSTLYADSFHCVCGRNLLLVH